MKLIILGDIHGRHHWRAIASRHEDAKIIFIGDYFDTFDPMVSAQQQIENFKDILAYKKANMNKVVLLFGNHDMHYLNTALKHYSGFQKFKRYDIQEVIEKARAEDLLQMCYIHDKFLFTHAGVTKTWCKDSEIDMSNLEFSINNLFKSQPNAFEFISGGDGYGNNIFQSPTWVRPQSLIEDKIDNYVQIVGHTVQDKLVITEELILIDTLGTSEEYLKIENGIATAVNSK